MVSRMIIEQQRAIIGINHVWARMHISTPQPQMSMQNVTPEMDIEFQMPRFRRNVVRLSHESGLSLPRDLINNMARKGMTAGTRAIRRFVDEGNHLGDVRRGSGGSRTAQLSQNRVRERLSRNTEINIGVMPESIPELEWEMGHFRINWSTHSVVIDWDGDYLPEVTIDPKHSIEVYLSTSPYIRIIVEPMQVDEAVQGRHIDQTY